LFDKFQKQPSKKLKAEYQQITTLKNMVMKGNNGKKKLKLLQDEEKMLNKY